MNATVWYSGFDFDFGCDGIARCSPQNDEPSHMVDSECEETAHHEKCGFAPCASGRIGRMRRTGKESFNMTTGCK